jgi:hypothetical protein
LLSILSPVFTAFGQLAHTTPSTVTPMERADPAIVRTAASRSAAVMSFIWSSAFPRAGRGWSANLDRMRRRGTLSTW